MHRLHSSLPTIHYIPHGGHSGFKGGSLFQGLFAALAAFSVTYGVRSTSSDSVAASARNIVHFAGPVSFDVGSWPMSGDMSAENRS